MTKEQEVLIILLQKALGDEIEFSLPEAIDWRKLIDLSFEQGVAAIAVDGLQFSLELREESLEWALDSPELEDLKYEWFGEVFQVENDYQNHLQKAEELTKLFAEAGFRSCILKGLSNAMLYPNPSHRQCGDIDIWVEGGRKQVLDFLRNRYKVGEAVVHHAHVEIFPDLPIEVHYLPAWLYNPFANRRLQHFFEQEADAQFGNMTPLGFACPQPKFNLVFNAVHIYKHYFQNEMTLKHLVDYYCILQHSTKVERQEAYRILKQVGLAGFASWLMGKLERELGLSPELALCPASDSETCHRPLGEMLCIYPWKLWHWVARKSF